MKLVCCFLLTVSLSLVLGRPEPEQYTSKYDNIDIDSILNSDRLLRNYVNCMMDRGNCTPDAAEMKANIPDALQTECSKCSEKQKKIGKKVMDFLIENKNDMWKELEAKYDPEGIYQKRYNELKASGKLP